MKRRSKLTTLIVLMFLFLGLQESCAMDQNERDPKRLVKGIIENDAIKYLKENIRSSILKVYVSIYKTLKNQQIKESETKKPVDFSKFDA